jgi:RES domain-containing protein
MLVYRISMQQYANKLTASGYAARWNPKGFFVLYTAQSRALACLENLVHRSGEGDNKLFKTLIINIPSTLKIQTIDAKKLKKGWEKAENYGYCQKIGLDWLSEAKAPILKVPSSIIKNEFNFIVNTHHPHFKKIILEG